MSDLLWPNSLREINSLPEQDKLAIYKTLLPDWLSAEYGVNPATLRSPSSQFPVVRFRCPQGSRAAEITVKRDASDFDPLMYLHMADTFNNQILVLLVVLNDLDAPRYHTDIDEQGNPTHFGTTSRNIPAEVEAMRAGLAPGQVRKGLRAFRGTVPAFEAFVKHMGHDLFLIEPLAYHNAIVFERYGFSYLRGHREMLDIHQRFEQGDLRQKLTPSNPFRQPDAWQTVRGRSWAIHDGILGHPFTGFQMYKRLGINAGIQTFPDARW
ncbi:hypothetical protein HC928_06040 [bacterium]|nr:hypothetical protein [bacterium]